MANATVSIGSVLVTTIEEGPRPAAVLGRCQRVPCPLSCCCCFPLLLHLLLLLTFCCCFHLLLLLLQQRLPRSMLGFAVLRGAQLYWGEAQLRRGRCGVVASLSLAATVNASAVAVVVAAAHCTTISKTQNSLSWLLFSGPVAVPSPAPVPAPAAPTTSSSHCCCCCCCW